MSELDEAWAEALAEAQQRAAAAGRRDVAEYLRLRASNDLLRQTGIDWLLNTFTILAGKANRAGASIQIAREDAHRFQVGNATMVGPLLTLSFGVRALSIEAGWPRAPRDGFVRGGGLACARIKHRGKKSANEDLNHGSEQLDLSDLFHPLRTVDCLVCGVRTVDSAADQTVCGT